MSIRRKRPSGQKCAVCVHEDRYSIELSLVSGVSTRAVGKKYNLSRDSCWRHLKNHVDQARRASLVAGGGPMKLGELAEKATAEGIALIDYLSMVRTALFSRFLAATECDDRQGTALLAGRLLQCLSLIAQCSGELGKATSSVTNNIAIMSSPIMADLQSMLVRTLQPFPEARQAVLAGLEELSARTLAQAPTPLLIEAPAHG